MISFGPDSEKANASGNSLDTI